MWRFLTGMREPSTGSLLQTKSLSAFFLAGAAATAGVAGVAAGGALVVDSANITVAASNATIMIRISSE